MFPKHIDRTVDWLSTCLNNTLIGMKSHRIIFQVYETKRLKFYKNRLNCGTIKRHHGFGFIAKTSPCNNQIFFQL